MTAAVPVPVVRAEGVEDTVAVASQLAKRLLGALHADSVPSILVGLNGPMGAGKTTFVRGFVEVLPGGQDAEISSPTYAIAQPYPTDPPVLHVDLFRIGSADDLEAIGGYELLGSEGLVLVEWLERLPFAVFDNWVEVRIDISGDRTRDLRLVPHGPRAAAWIETL